MSHNTRVTTPGKLHVTMFQSPATDQSLRGTAIRPATHTQPLARWPNNFTHRFKQRGPDSRYRAGGREQGTGRTDTSGQLCRRPELPGSAPDGEHGVLLAGPRCLPQRHTVAGVPVGHVPGGKGTRPVSVAQALLHRWCNSLPTQLHRCFWCPRQRPDGLLVAGTARWSSGGLAPLPGAT